MSVRGRFEDEKKGEIAKGSFEQQYLHVVTRQELCRAATAHSSHGRLDRGCRMMNVGGSFIGDHETRLSWLSHQSQPTARRQQSIAESCLLDYE